MASNYLSMQVNYLIDEAANTSKGANTVISMLHHYLATHSFGEGHLQLHADNYSWQNKNRYSKMPEGWKKLPPAKLLALLMGSALTPPLNSYRHMMQYLAWRCMVGLQETITLNFLMVGHTKFSPDWCFGQFKRCYCHTRVSCLDDTVRVVEQSAEVNAAQLVGQQDGTVIVPTYTIGLTTCTLCSARVHYGGSRSSPGKVFVKKSCNRERRRSLIYCMVYLADYCHRSTGSLKPAGLSAERQQYLFEKIREFCSTEVQDIVCPQPPGFFPSQPAPHVQPPPEQRGLASPPAKKQRLCSECKQPGHNKEAALESLHHSNLLYYTYLLCHY